MTARLIVSTDLDGTLLDHFNYSFEAAAPAMQRLESQGIPIIINTSKTFSEVLLLRQQMGNHHPFIVENGSGIVVPNDYFDALPESARPYGDYHLIDFGADYASLCRHLSKLKSRYQFTGFSDMNDEQIQAHTNLPLENAHLAKQRLFSEPLIWQDSDDARTAFISELAEAGIQALQGGRFLHVMAPTDKGKSLQTLKTLYETQWQTNCFTVALGDSANDIAMLEQADIAVIVRSPKHPPLTVSGRQQTIITDDMGPTGWNQAIGSILDERL
ncbi:MAG: mannosyl-3-phosphoglycerate phosphatase-related protein [Candidatus Pelagadaptatus aseana]|uniref:HAD-IIB family hydrolase n=1 Tax=Candidatus Pelagadaptatus aseana TaxID=3120508 RepID=UPI0039B161EA